MAIQTDLERYEEWRSGFSMSEEGPHTFKQLDKLRKIENLAWDGELTHGQIVAKISAVLSE